MFSAKIARERTFVGVQSKMNLERSAGHHVLVAHFAVEHGRFFLVRFHVAVER
jgi:hypothetical protein